MKIRISIFEDVTPDEIEHMTRKEIRSDRSILPNVQAVEFGLYVHLSGPIGVVRGSKVLRHQRHERTLSALGFTRLHSLTVPTMHASLKRIV